MKKLNSIIYAVVTTLDEAKEGGLGGIPNGHMYATLMGELNIDQWNRVVTVLEESGMVTNKNYLLEITETGSTFAASMRKAVAK